MGSKYSYKIVKMDGVDFVEGKYPVIIFNDELLPPGAIFIDFCASSNFFEDIDEDLSKWFWEFTNCVGLDCSTESSIIISYSEKLKILLMGNKEYIQKIIDGKYQKCEADKIFEWWSDTLDIMIKTAKNREISKWEGIPIINPTVK